MSDGKGSKKRENRKHVPYVVRVHEGEKGEEGSTLIIGGKRVRRKGRKEKFFWQSFSPAPRRGAICYIMSAIRDKFVSGQTVFIFLNRMEDGEKEWRWERGNKKPRLKRSEMHGDLPIKL